MVHEWEEREKRNPLETKHFFLCKTEKDWLGFFEKTDMEVRDIWTNTGMGMDGAHLARRDAFFLCVYVYTRTYSMMLTKEFAWLV